MPERKKTFVPGKCDVQNATRQQERFGQFSDSKADYKIAIADFHNFTLFYFKLYTVDELDILIHYEPSKILSTNENRTAPGKRAPFLQECQKTQCSLKMEYTLEI